MYWTCGSGRIELDIPKKIAIQCSHLGQCDMDIAEAIRLPKIKRQLDKLPNELMAAELREYGAWDEEDLKDINANKERILWIACGDLTDRNI